MAKEDSKNRVIFNAFSMALGTLSSRVLGLVRDTLLTAYFSRMVTDAWTVAFRLPNLFRRILGEGSLSVSFIPVFVEAQQNSPERSRNLMNGVYTLLLLILSLLTAFGIVFTEVLVDLMLHENYDLVPGKIELTYRMARIMFGFVFFISNYAFFMGILNALGSFGLAAMAPTLFNISMIISTIIPDHYFSHSGDGLAWGVLIGGALQVLILVPALLRKNYLPKVHFNILQILRNPDVKKVFWNMVPGLFGLGLLQITTLVNQHFASQLGEGVITYIYLADRLLELPLSLISVSLGVALLPTLSSLWSRNEKQQMSETTAFYLRLNFYMVSAAAVGLFMLARPIIEVLFQHGKFNEQDVQTTVEVVGVWAMIMVPSSLVRVLAPAYYAVKNTWLPAVVSLICLVTHLVIAPVLMQNFGLTGLNSSSLLSSSLNMILLLICYNKFVYTIAFSEIFRKISLFAVPLGAMAFVLYFYNYVESLVSGWAPAFLIKLVLLVAFIFAGILTFAGISVAMGLEESKVTIERVLGKLKRRISAK